MDLYEYQARDLFEKYEVPVLAGIIADTPEEAKAAAEKLGGVVVVKAQVKTGGRGKAGGVKVAKTPDEAYEAAKAILGLDIKGHVVGRVMVAAGATFTLGSFVSTAAHTSRHLAYKEAGISTRKNMGVFAWLFTAGTAALWAGSVSQYARYLDAEDGWDDLGYSLGTLMAMGVSMACEILNLAVFRFLWRRDMRRAEDDAMLAFTIAPTLRGPGLAMVGTF